MKELGLHAVGRISAYTRAGIGRIYATPRLSLRTCPRDSR
jgi:hypothetical protein